MLNTIEFCACHKFPGDCISTRKCATHNCTNTFDSTHEYDLPFCVTCNTKYLEMAYHHDIDCHPSICDCHKNQ